MSLADGDHPPKPALDDDWHPDSDPYSAGARGGGDRPGQLRVVDLCRLPRLEHARIEARTLERPAAADREAGIVDRRDDDRPGIGLEPHDAHRRHVQNSSPPLS